MPTRPFPRPALFAAVTAALLAVPAIASAQTTVLNFFDPPAIFPGLEAFVEDQAGYGDNAPNTSHVIVDFDGLQLWDTGFGNLNNVAYVDSGAGSSRPPFGVGIVTLTADPGFLVRLDSVDLAGFGGTRDFDSITVTGGDMPFSQNSVPAPGAGHNTVNFGGVTGQQLVLTFNDADSGELAGIDNLTFTQIIPEPASAGLLLAGFAAALTGHRQAARPTARPETNPTVKAYSP